MKINKIIIKGSSWYGTVDEAYEDKLTLTASSIAYEYKPHPGSNSPTNVYKQWSYKTNSPVFTELYNQIVAQTPYYLHNDEILFCTDIGPTTITAIYDDKHRETANYFCPPEFFRDYFKIIRKLIPPCEEEPAVISLYEEDE